MITACYSFGRLSLNVNGFTDHRSTGSILDCVWRKDASGLNEYIHDGRDVPELSTEQFGDRDIFTKMGWNFVDEENAWYYVEGVSPKRPHLNGLPIMAIPL